MLSLKRFLNASPEEIALRKVVSLLLEKIGADAVEADPARCAAFRQEIDGIRERASGDLTPDELFLAAGSAVQAMQSHNRQITSFLQKQGGELHSIMSMIADTVVKIGGENVRTAQQLEMIGDQFERAGALNDLRALKAHLSDCLRGFREETERQKAESATMIQSLQREVEQRREFTGETGPQELDAVTGLPRAEAGLRAMQEAMRSGTRRYIVAMVVRRIQAVNARFGFNVGDRILRTFKENVERQFTPGDQMFRWEGPTIVALLERAEPIAQVRSQVRRILDYQFEETFDVEGRSVLIPISASWTAFPLLPPLSAAIKQIQTFTASQGLRD